jgi:RND superfamily putative drug exporter
LGSGGFDDPASESSRAVDVIKRDFGKQQPDLVLLVTAKHGTVDDADVQAAAEALATRLAAEKSVVRSVSYWGAGSPPPLRSKDGRQALVLASLRGDEDQVLDAAGDLSPRYTRDDAAITVRVGGFGEVFRQVNSQVEEDLLRAELIAFPITLLLMVLVFGSVVAAGLRWSSARWDRQDVPRAADLSSLTERRSSPQPRDRHGARAAIDYSLFIVSLSRGPITDAVRRRRPHGRTAGKTVRSALTVAAAAALLCSLAFRGRSPTRRPVSRLAGVGAVVSRGAARGARTEGQLACCVGTRSRWARAPGTESPPW